MSHSKVGSNPKRKLTFKDEDHSDDVDDPSEVEEANGDSEEEDEEEEDEEEEEKKVLTQKIDSKNGLVRKRTESNLSENDSNAGETGQEALETEMGGVGPSPKRIKLSPSQEVESQQNSSNNNLKEPDPEKEIEASDDEPNYENIGANFFAEELTSDDEILTFQYPQNFDVKSLLNKTIDLSRETKLKEGNNKYVLQTIPNNRKKKFSCVFPSKEKGAVFLKLPVAGHLVLRQKLKLPQKAFFSVVEDNPENVQVPVIVPSERHPLLGNQWMNHCEKVKKQIKRHKKIFRQSLKHERSLEKAEKERKKQKKKLKDELALLKKKQIMDTDNS